MEEVGGNKRGYAARMGYDFVDAGAAAVNPSRPPNWSKIPAVRSRLPFYHWIFWNDAVQQNAYNRDQYAKEFGIKISEKLACVEARILPPPWLKYHDAGKEKECLPHVGQWNMKNKKMINGSRVAQWACVNFSWTIQESVAHAFCYELAQMCRVSGMEFSPEPVIPIYSARPEQVEEALNNIYHVSAKSKGKDLELLIAILPDQNGSLYGNIKRICETDLGSISQCCLTKHVFRVSKQYLANVSLKINVKEKRKSAPVEINVNGAGAFTPFKGVTAPPLAAKKEEAAIAAVGLPDLSLLSPAMRSPPPTIAGAGERGRAMVVGRSPVAAPVAATAGAHLSLQSQPQGMPSAAAATAARKARRCWSPELHQLFVMALEHLGGAQVSTPKQIRELMNVDGLTNDEVKSHLQMG